MINPFSDEYFMKQALEEAHKAFDEDEIPVELLLFAIIELLREHII